MTMWIPGLDAHNPTYAGIVDALRADIASGRLKPGTRLPTQRALARALGVSLGTITRAYKLSIEAGLVDAQIGRGTFVAHPTIGKSSAFAQVSAGFIDLSLDRPLESLSPRLGDALAKLSRRPGVDALLRYQPPEGSVRHREAGAVWLKRFGVDCGPDNVVLCHGSQHAIFVALSATTKPGDVVLVEQLTYPGMKAAAALLGLRLAPIPLDGDGILPHELERLCASRKPRLVYLMPGLQNPTNAQLTAARRERVAQIIEQRNLLLIEDEIREQSSTRSPRPLWCSIPDRTCFIGGFSKSIGGGLRVAFMAAPTARLAALRRSVWATAWTISSLPLEIAATWIEDGTAEQTVKTKIREAKRRQALARKVLASWPIHALPASYTLWLELPRTVEMQDFLVALEKRRVKVSPAEVFWVGDRRPPTCVRICLGAAETLDELRSALIDIRTALGNPTREPPIGLN